MMGLRKHFEVLRESLRQQREHDAGYQQPEQTDFLPAALEVQESPPHPAGRVLLWGLLSFLFIALLWAILGHIDVVAAAQGKIVPRGHVRIIQAADTGRVRAIHVREGASVKAGQPLIVLDPTLTAADAAQAEESLRVATIDRARATALVQAAQGRTVRFVAPPGMTDAELRLQQALVAARIAEHRTAIDALREEQAQRSADQAMVGAEVHKLEQQLPLAEMQLSSMESLQDSGAIPKLKVAEVKERVVGMRQDLVIRREEQGKNKAALAAVTSQIAKLESEFSAKALDALNEAEANYRLRSEEVKKTRDRATLTVLTSPTDGTVAQLAVYTIGAVVKPGDALLTIVPSGEELIVEAMVLNKDIGFVREGQPVQVKFEAFPFTRYGIVTGEVEHISHDAVDNKEQGLVFPCRVKLAKSFIEIGAQRVALAPGFAATAEIRTSERRIIEFLLSPLSRRLQEAGRER